VVLPPHQAGDAVAAVGVELLVTRVTEEPIAQTTFVDRGIGTEQRRYCVVALTAELSVRVPWPASRSPDRR
jgi:hypothetical protein